MAVINNIADLKAEKLRLKTLRLMQEQVFEEKLHSVQKHVEPYKNWFVSIDRFATQGSGTGNMLQNTIQLAVPLLIDKYLLGTKGFLLKRAATWITQAAASRLSQETPGELIGKLGGLIPMLKHDAIPFIRNLFHKGERKGKPSETGIS